MAHRQSITPRHALAKQRPLLVWVVVLGVWVNMLAFTGPLFALQVYDRVLSSRSVETLVVLTVLMTFLVIMMGYLDYLRKRTIARLGERFANLLERPVLAGTGTNNAAAALRDLEGLRQFLSSALFVALLDLPWFPVFLMAIALLHPALAMLSAAGAALLILPAVGALLFAAEVGSTVDDSMDSVEILLAGTPSAPLGARWWRMFSQWQEQRISLRDTILRQGDRQAVHASFSQTLRMFLQSAIVAMASWLVLRDELSAGAIIAASVLLARALSPLDLIGQNARLLRANMAAWRRLQDVSSRPTARPGLVMRPADGSLCVKSLTVFAGPERHPALRMVAFDAHPGEAVAVVGPSGAGKTTLARAIVGLCPIAGGNILLGGAAISPRARGEPTSAIGYLPQNPKLFGGTIAQNIALFDAAARDEDIICAARRSGAHEDILALPNGYETRLGSDKPDLPGGLAQQIALARAVFGDPALLLLDEPANNLDASGLQALNDLVHTWASTGKTALIMGQRPAAIATCAKVIWLQNGTVRAVGPKSEILAGSRPPNGPTLVAVTNVQGATR